MAEAEENMESCSVRDMFERIHGRDNKRKFVVNNVETAHEDYTSNCQITQTACVENGSYNFDSAAERVCGYQNWVLNMRIADSMWILKILKDFREDIDTKTTSTITLTQNGIPIIKLLNTRKSATDWHQKGLYVDVVAFKNKLEHVCDKQRHQRELGIQFALGITVGFVLFWLIKVFLLKNE